MFCVCSSGPTRPGPGGAGSLAAAGEQDAKWLVLSLDTWATRLHLS